LGVDFDDRACFQKCISHLAKLFGGVSTTIEASLYNSISDVSIFIQKIVKWPVSGGQGGQLPDLQQYNGRCATLELDLRQIIFGNTKNKYAEDVI
jgi:hypothetical protein